MTPFAMRATLLSLHPQLARVVVAGDRLEYLLVSTLDPRLQGDVWLSVVGPDTVELNTTLGRLERGSAIFMELKAPHFCHAGSCWLRVDFVPSVSCSANGAMCTCTYSELITVVPGHPGHLQLGPASQASHDDTHTPVACLMDKFGNKVSAKWRMLLHVGGGGWSRDFPRRCMGGYADTIRTDIQVPEPGDYECAMTMHLDNSIINSLAMRVLTVLPTAPRCVTYLPRVTKTSISGGMELQCVLTVMTAKLADLQPDTATAEAHYTHSNRVATQLRGVGFRELRSRSEHDSAYVVEDCTIRFVTDELASDCVSVYQAMKKYTHRRDTYHRNRTAANSDKIKQDFSYEILAARQTRRTCRVLTDCHILFGQTYKSMNGRLNIGGTSRLTKNLQQHAQSLQKHHRVHFPRHSNHMLRYAS